MDRLFLIILIIYTAYSCGYTEGANAYTMTCKEYKSITGWKTDCSCYELKLPPHSKIKRSVDNPCVYYFDNTTKNTDPVKTNNLEDLKILKSNQSLKDLL